MLISKSAAACPLMIAVLLGGGLLKLGVCSE